jgi:beta-N-acetylhexosaminidase
MKKIFTVCLLIFVSVQNIYSQSSDLRKKIGQMIMVGYSGKFLPKILKDDLQIRNLGGVVFFAANIVSPARLKSLTDSLKLLSNITPFIAIDQEGGKVARLSSSNGYEATYSAYKLGTIINNEDTTRWEAGKMAGWLRDGGINVNLAPVVDVNVNPLSPAIGFYERSFSRNPEDVFKHANWFISEFHSKNIITTLKHFPGHGSAMQDSHLGFTDISNTWADSELVPYQRLIGQDYRDFVMSGHLYNNKLDSVFPASLSKNIITDLLRNRLAYKGLIITDELFMQAITQNYTFEQSVEYAVNAGNDVLLFSTNIRNDNPLVEEVINIIEGKINEGKIPITRIEEAYNRIIELKQRYSLISSIAENNTSDKSNKLFLSNYPNPFNPATTITFSVPPNSTNQNSPVQLKVYDILGREVVTLINEPRRPGTYYVEFSSLSRNYNLTSGVYFCFLKVGEYIQIRKMFLMK